MSKIDLKCEYCGKKFQRERGEHNRNLKKGRNTFCSLSCNCSYGNEKDLFNNRLIDHSKSFGRLTDEYTPFRWFLRCAKRRRFKKEVTITLKYLKKLWENQKGKCPYTGWDLVLPYGSGGWISKKDKIYRASLDRIDCSKGYIEGNIQYVSFMANIAKGDMTDNEMLKFWEAVVNNK